MALYIILGILMFGVLIFIHELGHFVAAKKPFEFNKIVKEFLDK